MKLHQIVKTFILVFLSVVLLAGQAEAQKKNPKRKLITISGKVAFLNPESEMKSRGYDYNKVYIGKGFGRKYEPVDSVKVAADGTYKLTLDATVPAFYRVNFVNWESTEIWADADIVMNVRGYDTAKIKIKNPPFIHIESESENNKLLNIIHNQDYWDYQDMIERSRAEYFAGQHKQTDSAWITYLNKQREEKQQNPDRTDRLRDVLLKDYGDYPVIVRIIQRLNWRADTTLAMSALDNLIQKYPWHTEAKQLKKDILTYLVRSNMLQNGKEAPMFSYPDPDGNNISLASFKGQYVLIDFWASWCGPCRAAFPKIKKQYELYKDKGFTVFGVSIDEDEAAWRKAMGEEKISWPQVLSPNIDKTMERYMFSGIPTLYLVGPDGKIVDKYTGYSDELETKLAQIFNAIKS